MTTLVGGTNSYRPYIEAARTALDELRTLAYDALHPYRAALAVADMQLRQVIDEGGDLIAAIAKTATASANMLDKKAPKFFGPVAEVFVPIAAVVREVGHISLADELAHVINMLRAAVTIEHDGNTVGALA